MGLADHAVALADGIEQALPGWVEDSVARIMTAWVGSVPPDVAAAARSAGRQAQAEVGACVRALLMADIDDQSTTPLAILRVAAVPYPTEVLKHAGVPAVVRDDFVAEAFPDDLYDLGPAAFADLDPALGDIGIAWGAAKAFEHKRRHAV
jgi:hypothetical protein